MVREEEWWRVASWPLVPPSPPPLPILLWQEEEWVRKDALLVLWLREAELTA